MIRQCQNHSSWKLEVPVVIRGKEIRALVDSGVPLSYITPQLVKDLRLATKPIREYDITGVGGELVATVTEEIWECEMSILGKDIRQNLQVTPLLSYSIILGHKWLAEENPIIDWTNGRIQYRHIVAYLATEDLIPKEFPKLLGENQPEELPKHQPWDHEIQITDETKLRTGLIYRMTQKELKLVKEYIDYNKERGFIRTFYSKYGSSVLFVLKKDSEKLRLCVDFRNLNSVTVKDRYPILLISDLQEHTAGSR
jgi:Aspartyl protease